MCVPPMDVWLVAPDSQPAAVDSWERLCCGASRDSSALPWLGLVFSNCRQVVLGGYLAGVHGGSVVSYLPCGPVFSNVRQDNGRASRCG